MAIADFFARNEVNVEGLAEYLDQLSAEERIHAVCEFKPALQAQLYEAVQGHRSVGLEDLVPPEVPADTTVIHHGYNNQLPGFRRFQKRMRRPSTADGELWGYNHFYLRWLVGPGFFVVEPYADAEGEAAVNYYRIPPVQPEGWPKLRRNKGLYGLAYGNMVDVLRGVSRHVTIGRAIRNDKVTDNYFVLCREEVGASAPAG